MLQDPVGFERCRDGRLLIAAGRYREREHAEIQPQHIAPLFDTRLPDGSSSEPYRDVPHPIAVRR